jgi:hypothetical protein
MPLEKAMQDHGDLLLVGAEGAMACISPRRIDTP